MSYVFGDSLSSQPDGWAGQLMAQGHFYKLHAQSMRFGATGNIVPPDILPVDTCKTAVYALGTNDALLWDQPGYPDAFASAFSDDIGRLYHADHNGVKFNILILLPPTIVTSGRDTTGVREYLQLWVAVMVFYYGATRVRLVDLDDLDALDGSPDGVHISEAKATEIGAYLHQFKVDWEAEL